MKEVFKEITFPQVLPFYFEIKKLINYLFVLFALTLPFFRSAVSVFSGAIIVLSLYLIFGRAFYRIKQPLFKTLYDIFYQSMWRTPFLRSLWFFVFFQLLTFLWSSDLGVAVANTKNLGFFILIPVIAFVFDKKYLKYVVIAFSTGLLFHITASFLHYFHIVNWKKNINPTDPSVFMNRLDYTFFLVFAALLMLYTAIFSIVRKKSELKEYHQNALLIFLSLLFISMLFFLQGRTAQVLFVFVLPFVFYFSIPKRYFYISIILSIFSVIFVLTAAYYLSPNFSDRIDKTREEIILITSDNDEKITSSIGQRVVAAKIGYTIWKKNIFFGVGAGDILSQMNREINERFKNNNLIHRPEFVISHTHFHNQYIQILVGSGLTGLLFLIYLFFQFYKQCAKNDYLQGLSVIIILSCFWAFFTEPYLQKQLVAALLALAMGFVYQQSLKSEN